MSGSESSIVQLPSRLKKFFKSSPITVQGNKQQQSSKGVGGTDHKATTKGRKKRKWSKRTQKAFTDIVGLTIEIPGRVFGVTVPGLYYPARCLGKDASHRNAVTIRCVGDKAKYWMPVEEIRQFVREERERQQEREEKDDLKSDQGCEMSTESDQYAASVLVSLSGDRSARSRSVEVKSSEEDHQTSRQLEDQALKQSAWNMLTTNGVGWRNKKPRG